MVGKVKRLLKHMDEALHWLNQTQGGQVIDGEGNIGLKIMPGDQESDVASQIGSVSGGPTALAKQVPAINDSKRGGRADARLRTSKNVDSIDGSNHGESNAPTPQLPTDAINSINQINSPEIVDVDEIRE